MSGAWRFTTVHCARVWRWYAHVGAPEPVQAAAACGRAAAVVGALALPLLPVPPMPSMPPDVAGLGTPTLPPGGEVVGGVLPTPLPVEPGYWGSPLVPAPFETLRGGFIGPAPAFPAPEVRAVERGGTGTGAGEMPGSAVPGIAGGGSPPTAVLPAPGEVPVPEPATAALFCAAVVAVAVLRRRGVR